MVSFWKGLSWVSMCIPYYTQCRTCKHFFSISPTKAKCRRFIYLNTPVLVNESNKEIGETDLYLDVEVIRSDNNLCGKNHTYYERRIK